MPHHQNHYRKFLQWGLAIALVAVPLLAYANIEAVADVVEQPASGGQAAPTSVINPGAVTTRCDSQNWPNYTSDCVRGQHELFQPRQIALVTNDVPLTSLPRVVAAPVTQQHIVTLATQDKAAHLVERRRIVSRVPSRSSIAVRSESSSTAFPALQERVLAGW